MNPLRTAASALLCTFALVSQQAAAVEYRLPAANS
ncbi:MAG: L,D-transpeptidase, partial [Aeromonas veronii]